MATMRLCNQNFVLQSNVAMHLIVIFIVIWCSYTFILSGACCHGPLWHCILLFVCHYFACHPLSCDSSFISLCHGFCSWSLIISDLIDPSHSIRVHRHLCLTPQPLQYISPCVLYSSWPYVYRLHFCGSDAFWVRYRPYSAIFGIFQRLV